MARLCRIAGLPCSLCSKQDYLFFAVPFFRRVGLDEEIEQFAMAFPIQRDVAAVRRKYPAIR